MGPTATGKTDIAVELLKHLPIEIISVDSALVYKGMDIGTAKPSEDVLRQAPHRLINICEPTERYSAAQFRLDALKEIEDIEKSGRIPLLVGGTGLYFRTLEFGINELPQANEDIRKKLVKEMTEHGLPSLYQRLVQVDPESSERISCNDPQRIQRALEVFELTGKPLSEHFQQSRHKSLFEFDKKLIKIVLNPGDRERHRQQVKRRFQAMLEQGLIEEVKSLYNRGDLNASMPSMRMVGYRQVWRYLAGELDYDEMEKHAIVATRQLAKRQITWFRKEQNGQTIDSQDQALFSKILETLINDPLVEKNM